jgi:hypothetical protein
MGKKGIMGKSPKIGELGEIVPEERSETPTAMTSTSQGLGLGISTAATVGAVAAEAVQPLAHSQGPVPNEIVQSSAVTAPAEPVLQPGQDNAVDEHAAGEAANDVLDEDTPGASGSIALAAIPDESVPESEATLFEDSVSQPEPASVEEPEVVSTAPEPTHDIETAPKDASVTEVAQAEIPEEPPVQPAQTVEPAPPTTESKPVEYTNGTASMEPPSYADAQDDVDVPEEHPSN